MQLHIELRAVAERRHGVITRRRARALGASSEHLRRRIESPDWEALSSRVLRLVGSRRTFRQRCMAATLDLGAGGAISHESAAALWRLPGFPTGAVHVSRRRAAPPCPRCTERICPSAMSGGSRGSP